MGSEIKHPVLGGKPVLIGDPLVAVIDTDEGTIPIDFVVAGIMRHDNRDGMVEWIFASTDGEEYYMNMEGVRRPSWLEPCPDCAAQVGQFHQPGCDVAQCLHHGGQRLMCEMDASYRDHDCGSDMWTGTWPGVEDCRRLGFWCTDPRTPPMRPCSPDTPGASEDLNRLVKDCYWDAEVQRWELRK